jgi:hypothetical protein
MVVSRQWGWQRRERVGEKLVNGYEVIVRKEK